MSSEFSRCGIYGRLGYPRDLEEKIKVLSRTPTHFFSFTLSHVRSMSASGSSIRAVTEGYGSSQPALSASGSLWLSYLLDGMALALCQCRERHQSQFG